MTKFKCNAKDPATCRYHGTKNLVIKNGELVDPGTYKTSSFVRKFNKKGSFNSYFDGSWRELEALVEKHKDNWEPGTGSVNGDVILVNVPAEGFHTSIVEIDSSNRSKVYTEQYVRNPGEKPVTMRYIEGEMRPAKFVQVVCYRADVLAKDNDRSNNAEWKIIAVNAQLDKITPMHPATMLRNANHDEGGTYREYSDKEWLDAYDYWATHAYVKVKSEPTPV